MTLPRRLLPGQTYLVTRRCTQRLFLLRPSKQVEQVLTYCLAYAARKYGILFHGWVVLGNHVHLVCTDPHARLPAFMGWFDGHVARALNVHHRRGESFWAPGSYSAVLLPDEEALYDKLVYLITNAVAAGLVPTPALWPGLRTLPEEIGVQLLEATRPGFFFRQARDDEDDGAAAAGEESARARQRRRFPAVDPLPDRVTLEVTVPPMVAHTPADDFRAELARRVDARVRELHAERARRGLTSWLGADAVLSQDPFCAPAGTTQPDGSLNPRLACRDRWRRIELLQAHAEFWRAHQEASTRFRAGERDVLFPPGTYHYRVHFGARCSPAA
jgi:REP element-mobilizing transposase RayT